MPKSKKRKTNHLSSNNNGELTHEEIWDDSALIRSWNDAVAEYEFYHSIHAKGEDVDEVLRKYEEEQQNKSQPQPQPQPQPQDQIQAQPKPSLHPTNPTEDLDIEDGEIEDEPIETDNKDTNSSDHINPPFPTPTTTKVNAISTEPPAVPTQHTSSNSNPAPNPATQTLDSLKMAYYWAGYYSALHDAQTQTQTQTQPQPQPEN